MLGRSKRTRDTGENAIRIINAITSFADEVIDMYHHGIGPGALEPMTPALAKMMIADEVHRQLGEDRSGADWQVARLRIAGNDHVKILAKLDEIGVQTISARWVGKRNIEDDTVVYAWVKCSDVNEVVRITSELKKSGFEVRDGSFGLFLR